MQVMLMIRVCAFFFLSIFIDYGVLKMHERKGERERNERGKKMMNEEKQNTSHVFVYSVTNLTLFPPTPLQLEGTYNAFFPFSFTPYIPKRSALASATHATPLNRIKTFTQDNFHFSCSLFILFRISQTPTWQLMRRVLGVYVSEQ